MRERYRRMERERWREKKEKERVGRDEEGLRKKRESG